MDGMRIWSCACCGFGCSSMYSAGRVALLLGTLVSAGCAAAPSKPLCPVLVPYSRADQLTLATELPHDGAMTVRLVSDYLALRDAVRVCASTH